MQRESGYYWIKTTANGGQYWVIAEWDRQEKSWVYNGDKLDREPIEIHEEELLDPAQRQTDDGWKSALAECNKEMYVGIQTPLYNVLEWLFNKYYIGKK